MLAVCARLVSSWPKASLQCLFVHAMELPENWRLGPPEVLQTVEEVF
jgi:hypothetical protein